MIIHAVEEKNENVFKIGAGECRDRRGSRAWGKQGYVDRKVPEPKVSDTLWKDGPPGPALPRRTPVTLPPTYRVPGPKPTLMSKGPGSRPVGLGHRRRRRHQEADVPVLQDVMQKTNPASGGSREGLGEAPVPVTLCLGTEPYRSPGVTRIANPTEQGLQRREADTLGLTLS